MPNPDGCVLAIDPGYRTLGWAMLRAGPEQPRDAPAALRQIVAHGRVQLVDGSISEHLEAIRDTIVFKLNEKPPTIVAVELPAIQGAYSPEHGRARLAGVELLLLATGAIIAAATSVLGHARVVQLRAPRGRWARKPLRHEWLISQFKLAGRAEPTGPKGGYMPDVLDAIWIGVQVLRTPDLYRLLPQFHVELSAG